jgi:hypothetical protein
MEREAAVRLLVGCELLRSSLDRDEPDEPAPSVEFQAELDRLAHWAEAQIQGD